MQVMGCCVVTKKCCGFLDTVINKKNLYLSNSSLADYIIRNLKSPDFDYVSVHNVIKDKFDYMSTIKDWGELLKIWNKGILKFMILLIIYKIKNLILNG